MGEVYIKGREDRGSKETDGCPLTEMDRCPLDMWVMVVVKYQGHLQWN
jgi:hypothetical protein